LLPKTTPPEQHGRQTGGQLARQLVIRGPLGCPKHYSTTEHDRLRRTGVASDLDKFVALRECQTKSGCGRQRHSESSMQQPCRLVKTFMIQDTSTWVEHS
jgi:hypothetical protein